MYTSLAALIALCLLSIVLLRIKCPQLFKRRKQQQQQQQQQQHLDDVEHMHETGKSRYGRIMRYARFFENGIA